MLAEQSLQVKMLIESLSTHVREQQRAQESHLRMLNEFHREQARSGTAVDIMEERNSSMRTRMEEMKLETG
eukprot:945045-Prorocentrum_lima.AAC.1